MPPSDRGPSAREQAKRETREALMDAALTEFAERGLEAPSLDAICARAGYTRGAFYVHFADRDELIGAVMERVIGVFLDAVIATGDAALDLERTIRFFSEAVMQGSYPLGQSVRYYQVLQACARSPMLKARHVGILQEATRRLSHAVGEGQSAGSVRQDLDPELGATMLLAIVIGIEILRELEVPIDARAGGEMLIRMLRAKHETA